MLKVEGSTDKAKRRQIMLDIFREYEGKVKERMGKQYESVSGKRTCSPIISNSVESMLGMIYDYGDIGQFRRFIEIKIEDEKTLFKSAVDAENTENAAYTYYGYGIEVLMTYIFEELNYIKAVQRMFNEFNVIIKSKLEEAEKKNNVKGLQSSSKRFALLIVSYHTITNALNYYTETSGLAQKDADGNVIDSVKDKAEEILDMLINNIVDKMKMIKVSVNIKKSIDNFVKKHNDLFHKGDSKWDDEEQRFLGHLTEKDDEYIIEMRKNSNVGWLMVSAKEFEDEELLEYIDVCIATCE